MKLQKHAFPTITLATRKKSSTRSTGRLRLLLSAVTLMTLCFSFPAMAPAQTATAYSKEAMEQALATKHHYDLYGIHFDFDKAVIQSDSNALLDDITTTLKHFPKWRLTDHWPHRLNRRCGIQRRVVHESGQRHQTGLG